MSLPEFYFCILIFITIGSFLLFILVLTENFSVTILTFNKCRNYLLTPLVWALLRYGLVFLGQIIHTNHPGSVSNLPAPITNPSGGVFDPSAINPQGFFKFGFPGPIHDLANRTEFVSCYDRSTRNPYWVIEHITKASLAKAELNGDRKRSVFKEDEAIPLKFRNRLRDYFRSGFDRGHQAPAADAKFNQLAMDETFYLTNMCPQVGDGFNRDYWSHFEDFVRRLTNQYDDVRVMTGPLYLPKLGADGKYE